MTLRWEEKQLVYRSCVMICLCSVCIGTTSNMRMPFSTVSSTVNVSQCRDAREVYTVHKVKNIIHDSSSPTSSHTSSPTGSHTSSPTGIQYSTITYQEWRCACVKFCYNLINNFRWQRVKISHNDFWQKWDI